MKNMCVGDKLQIQCYKHNGNVHRAWDEAILLDEQKDYIVFGNNNISCINYYYYKQHNTACNSIEKRRNRNNAFDGCQQLVHKNSACHAGSILRLCIISYCSITVKLDSSTSAKYAQIFLNTGSSIRTKFCYNNIISYRYNFRCNRKSIINKKTSTSIKGDSRNG